MYLTVSALKSGKCYCICMQRGPPALATMNRGRCHIGPRSSSVILDKLQYSTADHNGTISLIISGSYTISFVINEEEIS